MVDAQSDVQKTLYNLVLISSPSHISVPLPSANSLRSKFHKKTIDF